MLYGGYSRVKATIAAGKTTKGGGGGGQKNVLKPMVHQDCFFLRITPPGPEAASGTPPVVRWEKRKKPANAPNPTRAGATMAFHKGRGILFGGVHDVEESEEGMESEFFNQLFAWNVERNRFFLLALRKSRAGGAKKGGEQQQQRVGRRGRAQANEDELLRQLAALQAGGKAEDADDMEIDRVEEKAEPKEERKIREMPVSMEMPHPRFNAQLAVQDDVLYIYGGTFEKGDREFTFDDMYAIDLGKMDGCKEIFNRPVEDWIVSCGAVFGWDGWLTIFQASDDEDDDEEWDDEEDDDEEEDGDVEIVDEAESKKDFALSKRKKKQADEESIAATESSEPSVASSEDDESETDTAATSVVDDGLPHPRVRFILYLHHTRANISTALRVAARLLPAHVQ
jgi:hypothetical protein